MRITRAILTYLCRVKVKSRQQFVRHNEKAPDHQARGSKVCLEIELCACPIDARLGHDFTLRIRPKASRLVRYRRWGSIQHQCHHALLSKKKQYLLSIGKQLTLDTYQKVSSVLLITEVSSFSCRTYLARICPKASAIYWARTGPADSYGIKGIAQTP